MSPTGRGRTWGDPLDPAGARGLMRRAAEFGVQLFDTADSYGPETGERLLREALHPYDGLPPPIATKGGGPFRLALSARVGGGLPPGVAHGRMRGERLRRLGLERIDLYQLHVVDARVPLEESGARSPTSSAPARSGTSASATWSEASRAPAPWWTSSAFRTASASLSRAPRRPSNAASGTALPSSPGHRSARASSRGARGPLRRSPRGTAPRRARSRSPGRCGLPPSFAIPGTASAAHLEENLGAARLELTEEDAHDLAHDAFYAYWARRLARSARPRREGEGDAEAGGR